jgi:hypothetical protein
MEEGGIRSFNEVKGTGSIECFLQHRYIYIRMLNIAKWWYGDARVFESHAWEVALSSRFCIEISYGNNIHVE